MKRIDQLWVFCFLLCSLVGTCTCRINSGPRNTAKGPSPTSKYAKDKPNDINSSFDRIDLMRFASQNERVSTLIARKHSIGVVSQTSAIEEKKKQNTKHHNLTTYEQYGEAIEGDGYIYSLALSGDSSVLVTHTGRESVRIFGQVDSGWSQRGPDIEGNEGDNFGYSLDIARAGLKIVVGAMKGNYAKAFFWSDEAWTQLGQTMRGCPETYFGYKVSISSAGSTVAVGAPYYDDLGQVLVFDFLDKQTWEQRGLALLGNPEFGFFGRSMQLSGDSSSVIVSASPTYNAISQNGTATVYVFEDDIWKVKGTTLYGGIISTGVSASISYSAEHVCIGTGLEYVKCFYFEADEWKQRGQLLSRDDVPYFGESLQLSSDSSLLAISSTDNTYYGNMDLYQFEADNWNLLESIQGEKQYDGFGYPVAISDDGRFIAAAAPYYNINAGRVYTFVDPNMTLSLSHVSSRISTKTPTWTFSRVGKPKVIESDHHWIDPISSMSRKKRISTLMTKKQNYAPESFVKMKKEHTKQELNTFEQYGIIDGDGHYEQFGYSLALSGDSSVLVAGAPWKREISDRGIVRIFGQIDSGWSQLGPNIEGDEDKDFFGTSLDVARDGLKIVVGASGGNYAKTFFWADEAWTQLGQTMRGCPETDFGYKVSISSIGLSVAVSAPSYDDDLGQVLVFDFLDKQTWEQRGFALLGSPEVEKFGRSIQLSGDSSSVTVSASPINAPNGTATVYVFEDDIWKVKGSAIYGGYYSYYSVAVSISYSAEHVCIGTGYDYVKCFYFEADEWKQRGQLLSRDDVQYFGHLVQLSSDSSFLAIGSPYSDIYGNMDLYQFEADNWNLLESIQGEHKYDGFGYPVAISDNGQFFAASSYGYNGINVTNSGRVYTFVNPNFTLTPSVAPSGMPTEKLTNMPSNECDVRCKKPRHCIRYHWVSRCKACYHCKNLCVKRCRPKKCGIGKWEHKCRGCSYCNV